MPVLKFLNPPKAVPPPKKTMANQAISSVFGIVWYRHQRVGATYHVGCWGLLLCEFVSPTFLYWRCRVAAVL